jgi:nitrile hydratase beta subunit
VNGVHDMGGMQGLGPVAPETDEPVFHETWEGRVLALVVASPTRVNIDQGRHERELIFGPDYLRMTYFERWFAGLKGLLLKMGFATAEELATGNADPAAPKATPRLAAADVMTAFSRRGSYRRETSAKPAFAVGDKVRARNIHPEGHSRLPRYARGRVGAVERLHGAHVFADTHAHTGEDDPQPLYTVRFTAQELWGPQASPRDSVSLDLWEPHLERA